MVKIGKAANIVGVTPETLRKWDKDGELLPDRRSKGGTRFYDRDHLLQRKKENMITIAYARVSSHDQKSDLVRQVELLQSYCTAHGWIHEIIQDLGSGLNYNKKGLKRLLDMILDKSIERVVVNHKDCLLRFGAELIFQMCEKQGIEVVVINTGEELSFEQELAQDILEIITVFSAKLHGSRSKKHKEVMEAVRNAVST